MIDLQSLRTTNAEHIHDSLNILFYTLRKYWKWKAEVFENIGIILRWLVGGAGIEVSGPQVINNPPSDSVRPTLYSISYPWRLRGVPQGNQRQVTKALSVSLCT